MPKLPQEWTCLSMEMDTEISSSPSLVGATGGVIDSAAISPCREVIRQSEDDLSCPERPEEQVFIVKALEGTSQPGVGWPTAPGASLPVFPRVGGSRVRGPPELMPLVLELYQRMDHLDDVIQCQQRMLNSASI